MILEDCCFRAVASGDPLNRRILIHDYAGHGFIAELSRELAARGYQVIHVYGAHNPTPKGYVSRLPDDPEGLTFLPISLSQPFQKYSFFRRWQQEREYGRRLAEAVLTINPDIVISAQSPLDAERLLDRACRKAGIPRVHWLQDVIGVATAKILRKKIPILGGLIGQYYLAMEKSLLKSADLVLSISEDFSPLLDAWGIPASKVRVLPNWPTLKYLPVVKKDNRWSREQHIQDRFVFLYTGTLGFKHNPKLLLDLADSFEDEPEVCVVVASEGPGADWLKEQITTRDGSNMLILPYQPLDRYAQVLASGDVLVGILEEDAGVYSVPSKILSYLCARRPLLLSMPVENRAARIVCENEAGIVIPPCSRKEFLESAFALWSNETSRINYGKRGREYAEIHFNIAQIGDSFEMFIKEIDY